MPARRISSALLLLMACGVLNACGGGGEPVSACDSTGTAPMVLVWDAVTGAEGYRIYVRTAPGSYLQNLEQGLDVGNATTFTATTLAAGTTYHFAVTAYDSIGESDFSNEACQTIVN
jgi:fibronectin type 3 domain-containing protein